MSQRERHASGGVSDAGPPPAAGQPTPSAAPQPGATPGWEELYQSASPAQRRELLALAARQGLLYAHQLPASANGVSRDHRQQLAHLLAGHTDSLEPLRVQPDAINDDGLDSVQREAVAKALHTPDVCLIQGLPGTGKTRVLAEVITRAAARGERVLLLAPTPAALDHVLGLIARREVVYAVRCPGREENAEAWAPPLRDLTFAERKRQLKEHTLESARQSVQATEERWARLQRSEPLWPHLGELAERHLQLAEQLGVLEERRGRLVAEVEQEARQAEEGRTSDRAGRDAALHSAVAGLYARLRESSTRIATDRAGLVNRRAGHERKRDELAAEIARIRPLVAARQQKRWWTWTWWRAVFQGNVSARLEERDGLQRQVLEELDSLKEEIGCLDREKEQAEQSFQKERARLTDAAVARGRAELDDQEAALRQESSLVQEKWQAACRELGPEIAPPDSMTREAFRAAHDAWRQQLQQEEERRTFGRLWTGWLEENADTLAARLRDFVNVVAATASALHGDENFGDAAPPIHFDLLVLEGADQVAEAEFLNVARRARRWVLAGHPAREEPRIEDRRSRVEERMPRGDGPRGRTDHRAPAAARSAILDPRSAFFHRLWEHLHFDPRRLPYSWVHEKDGLCCRLRPMAPEQRQWLQCERVADSPDIELRILAPPRMPSTLAEVVFPARMSIAQAKEYIFRELSELPVRAERHSLHWVEEQERLVLRLAEAPAAGAVPVVLGHGVRELVAARPVEANGGEPRPASWHTCLVEFDRRAGWHRQMAEEWVQQHLGVSDPGRTVRLDVPYRMHPELAAFLSGWLFTGAYDPPPASPDLAGLLPGNGSPAVQFIPVPSLAVDRPQGRRGGPAARQHADGRRSTAIAPLQLPKAGAGLELDAGDPRHRERLPAELRAGFSGQGYINHPEALAVVRTLETLAADPALRAAGQTACPSGRPVIGVLALYPAQAELIRRLMVRVPALAAPEVSIKVDVPAAFREGECLVGLVSLTRSHSHRAVSFGEGPHLLVRALTRARARLILLGDPGTLARRSQWEAPLDHLDERASAWEHEIISRLVGYLHGQGAPPHRFQLCEVSST